MKIFLFVLAFLLCIIGFSMVAPSCLKQPVEADLASRSRAALDEKGLSQVMVTFNELGANLSGEVENADQITEAEAVVSELWGTYIAANNISERPKIPPTVAIIKGPRSTMAVIEGIVSSAETRQTLEADVKSLPMIETVDNRLEINPKLIPLPVTSELAGLAGNLFQRADSGRVFLAQQKLKVEGEVLSQTDKDAVMTQAAIVWDKISAVEDGVTVTPPQSSEFHVVRSEFGITVTGRFAEQARKDQLIQIVRASQPGVAITDGTIVGGHYTDPLWAASAVSFLPKFLSQTQGSAEAHYSDTGIRAFGTVNTNDKKTSLGGLVAESSIGLTNYSQDLDIKVVVPATPQQTPIQLAASFDGNDLTLDGIVPNQRAEDVLVAAVQAAQPGAKVVDRLQIDAGAENPAWLESLAGLVTQTLKKAENGRVEVNGSKVSMSGHVTGEEVKNEIGGLSRTVFPTGTEIRNLLTFSAAPAPAPETKLVEALKLLPIYFDTSSSAIKSTEREKIDLAADAIKKAGSDAKLTVGGYADKRGNATSNKNLSIKRANAVRDRLISLGIDEDQLDVDHYGEDTSNMDASDLWKARRVEVSISE